MVWLIGLVASLLGIIAFVWQWMTDEHRRSAQRERCANLQSAIVHNYNGEVTGNYAYGDAVSQLQLALRNAFNGYDWPFDLATEMLPALRRQQQYIEDVYLPAAQFLQRESCDTQVLFDAFCGSEPDLVGTAIELASMTEVLHIFAVHYSSTITRAEIATGQKFYKSSSLLYLAAELCGEKYTNWKDELSRELPKPAGVHIPDQ